MKKTLSILVVLVLAAGVRGERVPPAPKVRAAQWSMSSTQAVITREDARRGLGLYQKDALWGLTGAAPAAVESLTVGVIRVSFQDLAFGSGLDGTPHDSLYFENELRHLREYFAGASVGHFSLETILEPGILRLSRPESYYGEDDLWEERVSEMVMETVEALDSLVDFSRFDALALLHAGAGQETDFNGDSPGQLWSGFIDPMEMAEVLADTLGTPGVPTADSLGGEPFYIDNVIVWPETAEQDDTFFGSLGIYAYQVGLRIGMIPLFDTTPSGFPDSQGIGQFGLMGYGLYNAVGFVPAFPSAFHRYLMGWAAPVEIGEDSEVRLRDINIAGSGDTALVRIPISPSEYFLVANRVHDTDFDGRFDFIDIDLDGIPGNRDTLLGAEFDFFLTSTTNPVTAEGVQTGSGILVWHIDEEVIISSLENDGYPNDDASRKGVDLEEADGIQDLDKPGGVHSFGSYYDTFREGNKTRFGPETVPSTDNNGGIPSGILLDGISAPDQWMDFILRFEPPVPYARADFDGIVGRRSSPIPSDLDLDGVVDLVIAADTGVVLVCPGAGSIDHEIEVDTLFHVAGELWTGPPVLCNAGAGDEPEIFITSKQNRFFAFHGDGSPYPVGDPASPGRLELDGSVTTTPMAIELDGDPFAEVIFLCSTEEETLLYLAGYSSLLQDERWETAGTGIVKIALSEDRIVSHAAAGFSSIPERSWIGSGVFFASRSAAKRLLLNFVPMGGFQHEMGIIEPVVLPAGEAPPVTTALSQPAAGDVDGDGNDEGLFTIPGAGLFYFEPDRGSFTRRELAGGIASAPVLADLDGDGVMETALRDGRRLYLLTGFGSPVVQWPKEIPEQLLRVEDEGGYASPLIADIDGDGSLDMLFRIGGDLYGYSSGGELLEGWPYAGEGSGYSTPALIEDDTAGLLAFVCGTYDLIEGGVGAQLSSVRRYAVPNGSIPAGAWPFYRLDAHGSARAERMPATVAYAGLLDENSFICYPNPVRGSSFTIRLMLYHPATVRVTVLNLEGEKVYEAERTHVWVEGSGVPFEEHVPAGDLAGGVYICRLEVRGGGWHWRGFEKIAVTR